jgi:lysophospholipase L1-like esterase
MSGPVFKFCTLIFLLLLMAGCSKQGVPSAPNRTDMPPSTNLRYLALGDSYTIGESVAAHERFPYLTAALLRTHGFSINDPVYVATTGWTTANLLAAIETENLNGTFDVVSLLIGVNDQYQRLDTAGYRMRFTQLLQKAVALAGNRRNRVFVLSIPDYSATPFVNEGDKARVRTEIDAFNAINKEVTISYGHKLIQTLHLQQGRRKRMVVAGKRPAALFGKSTRAMGRAGSARHDRSFKINSWKKPLVPCGFNFFKTPCLLIIPIGNSLLCCLWWFDVVLRFSASCTLRLRKRNTGKLMGLSFGFSSPSNTPHCLRCWNGRI